MIIKLDTIDSTNAYLKKIVHFQEKLPDFLTVWTPHQTDGKGQYGAKWQVEPYKNLTFSVLRTGLTLPLHDYFLLNMHTSIAVVRALEELFPTPKPTIAIKWPNDILLSGYKIGGILIENIVRSTAIEKSIIGIGLNVNQTYFHGLPHASSLKEQTLVAYDIESLLHRVLNKLKEQFATSSMAFEKMYSLYENYLFRLNQSSNFYDSEMCDFQGIIRGVAPSGELKIQLENGNVQLFSLKEVTMKY